MFLTLENSRKKRIQCNCLVNCRDRNTFETFVLKRDRRIYSNGIKLLDPLAIQSLEKVKLEGKYSRVGAKTADDFQNVIKPPTWRWWIFNSAVLHSCRITLVYILECKERFILENSVFHHRWRLLKQSRYVVQIYSKLLKGRRIYALRKGILRKTIYL